MNERRGGGAIAPVAFVVLILATFAALLITQRLKHAPPLLQHAEGCTAAGLTVTAQRNLVCRHSEHIDFTLTVTDTATVTIHAAGGRTIATLLPSTVLAGYSRQYLHWSTRTSSGAPAPDGHYTAWIDLVGHHVSFEIWAFDLEGPRA